jgi:hypothetical protein
MTNQAPYIKLQALPDFSAFQFTSIGDSGNIVRQVRFNGHQNGRIYHLDLRDLPAPQKGEPGKIADCGDMDIVMATLMQIIEIYTERYPRRTVRLRGNTRQKARLYRTALEKHLTILHPIFMVELEKSDVETDIDSIAFLLKRKPIPYFTIHTIHTTWNGQSRLFDKKVTIELNKTLRIGVALPAL